jgi:hypothetical protein
MKRERGKRKIYGYASAFVVAILILSTLGILPGFAQLASVTRDFTPIAVQPNAEFDVTLAQTNFFLGVGTIIETLPPGFTYIDGSYTGGGSGNEVTYDPGTRTLTAKKAFVDVNDDPLTTATYRVKASSSEQAAEFAGTYETFVYPPGAKEEGAISGKKRIGVDATAPFTDGYSPANGASGVSVNTNIVVHVKDNFAVDPNTIVMTVNGAIPASARISKVPVTLELDHWQVTYDPVSDFGFEQTVIVTVTATDYAGNAMASPDFFSFTTTGAGPTPTPTPTPDTTSPAPITNLATSNPTMITIDLMWTAPGDDGATGTAAAYDIRYQEGTAVTDANWATATQVTGEPSPKAGGSSETFTVTGLAPNTTYYFAMKTADEVPNWSPISNSPMGMTTAATICFEIDFAMGYNMISMPLDDPVVVTAATLANKVGISCTEIVRWDSATQSYVSFVPTVPLNNFAIEGGMGYLVNLNNPTPGILFCNSGWTSPFAISLLTGYNMIGIPVNDSSVTSASTLATKVGGNCTEVVMWDSATQTFVSFIPGVPLNNFTTGGGAGYLVNVNNPTMVTFTGTPWQN